MTETTTGARRPGADLRESRRVAAILWLAAAAVYIAAEALSASVFTPTYRYTSNYISDLGVTTCGLSFEGRAICSPLHDVMNAGFIVQGLMFVAAAVVAARCVTSPARHGLVVLAAVNCIGIGLVGIVHEATAQGGTTFRYHVLGAFLAIVAGNATALVSRVLSQQLGLPAFHRLASLILPIVGLVGLVMLIVAQSQGTVLVPDAVWERLSVYTITAWEIVTGVGLLAIPRRDVTRMRRSA